MYAQQELYRLLTTMTGIIYRNQKNIDSEKSSARSYGDAAYQQFMLDQVNDAC